MRARGMRRCEVREMGVREELERERERGETGRVRGR